MNYIPINFQQKKEMLDAVGVENIEELFVDVPKQARLKGLLPLGDGAGEMELVSKITALAKKNTPATELVSFAGAGCYDHYIPSFIDHLLVRPEFFTAYTPYQPEVSQGTLQAVYEYQTGICQLTGLDMANASMYDGATAMVEAAFMAVRLSRKRDKVVVAGSLHPEYLETLKTYTHADTVKTTVVDAVDGVTPKDDILSAIDDTVAAVIVGYPNFYGAYEPPEEIADEIHAHKGLLIVVANPFMLGLVEAPGNLGADIVVGEAQPLGNPMSFGGPGLGYFACTSACTRQMPGRIVGKTTDVDGHTGYVLTLSTREQHIRREKATSNICSNHALNALAAGMYLAGVGPTGLKKLALSAVSKARYLHDALIATGRFEPLNEYVYGYEFALVYKGVAQALYDDLFERGYISGVVLDEQVMLFAVTEKRSREEIDAFVSEVEAHG